MNAKLDESRKHKGEGKKNQVNAGNHAQKRKLESFENRPAWKGRPRRKDKGPGLEGPLPFQRERLCDHKN